MNVVSIERSRSGDADASWSWRKRAGSILLGAVTVVVSFRSTVRGLPKDHAVAAFCVYATPITGPVSTLPCRT
jgi:hypothetical protein